MAVIATPPCDEAAILAGVTDRTDAGGGRWVLAATILGSSMAFIDSTVVNVALPALQSALGATLAEIQWVVESYAALSGALFFLPLNLIQVQGYSATAAGAALLPFIVIMFLLSRWSGGLVKHYGAKLPLVIGPIIASLGFALFILPGVAKTSSYWITFFPAVVVLGLGMAVSVAPLTTTVMNAVNANRAGIASGINNAVSRTAGLLAIAVLGIVMLHSFNHHLDLQLQTLGVPAEVKQVLNDQRTKLAGAQLPPDIDPVVGRLLKQAVDESFVAGFRRVVAVAAGLALLSALSAWLLIEGKPVSSER